MTENSEFITPGQPAPLNNPLQKDRQLTPGQMLEDKYEVISLIGVGGMGKVYKVRQVFLNKALALKVLDLQQMGEMQIRRFQLEAKAAFSLSHPNLVKVFDFGLLDKVEPYLVMDFVDGVTLHEHLRKSGPLTPEQAVKVFVQAASGLAYAHRYQVVHRDIKPSNIMLDAQSKIGTNNSVKIVDFGIAKLAESGEVQGLTRTGEVFGSPLYMSPEQCSGEIVDHRSDIYSLGCSLFEALTGTPPHVGNSALRTMMLHQTAPAPYLREASLGTSYPENLEVIVHKMLEKSPSERYQILEEVVDDLNKALGEVSLSGKKTASPSSTLSSKKQAEISMAPANFAMLMVTVMALTSASTIGIERLIQHYGPHPVVVAKAEQADSKFRGDQNPLPTEGDTVEGEKTQTATTPETAKDAAVTSTEMPAAEKENSIDEKATAATDKDPATDGKELSEPKKDTSGSEKISNPRSKEAEAIIAKAPMVKATLTTGENGIKVEDLNFPDIQVGVISNVSFAVPEPVLQQFAVEAMSTVRIPPSKRLQLNLDRFSQGFEHPEVLNKMDPALFQELIIQSNRYAQAMQHAGKMGSTVGENFASGVLSGAMMGMTGASDRKHLNAQLVEILENASRWTELDGVFINELNLKSDAVEALSKCKKLQYLRLLNCEPRYCNSR